MGRDIMIALDVAASELYIEEKGGYIFAGEGKKGEPVVRTTEEMISYYEELVEEFPIFSIEDPLDEEDWDGWKKLTKKIGNRVQLVGDDLFVTNAQRLRKGIELGAANAILIKVNQIGTLSETFETIKTAQEAGYNVIVSHRSGETEDTIIADIAVAFNTGQIKTGAPCRSERVAKYNRLLRIEEQIGDTSEMQKAIAMLDEVKESIINAYEIKTGMSRAKLSHLMDAETWMDAHTAIDMGFADEILTRPAETPVENNATGPMLFSRAAVTNSLMDKLAAKCRIKKPETPERSVDSLMERLDLIKQYI